MKGRKRHILLKVVVHAANLSESAGGKLLLSALGSAFPRLAHLWTDQGYKPAFVEWVAQNLHWTVEVVSTP